MLKEHLRLCVKNGPTQVCLPKEGVNILKFEEYDQEIPVPIIVYADFEATILPIVGSDSRYQSHEVNSFCTLVKTSLFDYIMHEAGISTQLYVYRSHDAARHFISRMHDLARKVEELYSPNEYVSLLHVRQGERASLSSDTISIRKLR